MLLEKISKESVFDSIAKELYASGYPLIVYGCGIRARKICDLLSNKGIKIDAVVVSRQYYSKNSFLAIKDEKIPVQVFEDVINKYGEVNIFAGFSMRNLNHLKLYENKKVHKVYTFNCGCFPTYNITHQFLKENGEWLESFYDMLADEKSKELLTACLDGRVSGSYKNMAVRYDTSQYNKYFADGFIKIGANECFVDCGAFNGDTVLEFISKSPAENSNKIFCFEPDANNVNAFYKNTGNIPNLKLFQLGVWSKKETLCFSGGQGESSTITEQGSAAIDVDSIDNLIPNDEKVTIIKMDIEGSEYEALVGAQKTIVRDKPSMAICVYHRYDDLVKIPKYIHTLVPQYKFYLRQTEDLPTELFLTAVI